MKELNFSVNTEFLFDLYENVPVGQHSARLKNILVEESCVTQYGVKDRITVVFHLPDIDKEFIYSCNKSSKPMSKYYQLFSMFCTALGTTSVDTKSLVGKEFEITISMEPLLNQNQEGRFYTKITDIKVKGGDLDVDEETNG